MNKARLGALIALAAWIGSALVVSANPSVYPTGVTRYDPAKAYDSYFLFSGPDKKTHLIDMDGNEVRRWDYDGSPSLFLDPALVHGQRGHILVQVGERDANGPGVVPGQQVAANKAIGELDWNGKVVWQWGSQAPGGQARQHHDLARLANGNTLLLAANPGHLPGFAAPRQLDDLIYEVNPAGAIVWRWVLSEHLDELGFTPQALALVRAATAPSYLHLNDMRELGPNKWFDAGDKRFAPANIMINSRNANVVAIIDKTSGHIVWRLGPDLPPLVSGDPIAHTPPAPPPGSPVNQFLGAHDAYLIPKGLPGAGNLLMFDNQGSSGFPPKELALVGGSRILEIDPTKGTMVWSYTAADSGSPLWTFKSAYISSARRLPDGNTLIDEGMNGRIFQVTPAGEIVWEYVSPFYGATGAGGGGGNRPLSNQIYRAQPVPFDWAPRGTPHTETPLPAPDQATFRSPR
jgi:hypothetical protein